MKIAFINQVPQNHGYVPAIGALSAFIKKKSTHKVALFNYRGYNTNQLKYQLATFSPDVIAFSTVSLTWMTTQSAAKFCKSLYPKALIICGGYHPTLAPDEVIADPFIDILCRGEGEGALLDLLDALEKDEDYSQIKNLWVKKDGAIYKNEIRPLIEDLDSLPFPDRDLFDYDAFTERSLGFHADKLKKERVVTINTGKGCYFSCTYCSNAAMKKMYKDKGQYIRYRSVDNVIQEMKILKERYNPDYIESKEELFATDLQWLEEFAEKYPKEIGLPIKISYRVELATDRNLELLVKSGCVTIAYGVECGNEEYRKKYLNRKMSNQQIIDAFRRTKDAGIEILSFNMMGLPYETYENIQETIALNRQIKPDFIHWFAFQPYPGTQLYDLCKKDDLFLHDETSTYFSTSPNIKLPTITQEEFAQCVKDFFELEIDLQGFSWRDPEIQKKITEVEIDGVRKIVPGDEYKLTDFYNKMNGAGISVAQWQNKYLKNFESVKIIIGENKRRGIVGYLPSAPFELHHDGKKVSARKFYEPLLIPQVSLKNFVQNFTKYDDAMIDSDEAIAFLYSQKADDFKELNLLPILDIKKLTKSLLHIPKSFFDKLKNKTEKLNYTIKPITEFDEAVDKLWEKCSENLQLTIKKDSQYLDWRYSSHPEINYLSIAVYHRKTNELCGLAILRLNWEGENCTSIVEWLVPNNTPKIGQILLQSVEHSAIVGGTQSVQIWINTDTDEFKFFLQNGYNKVDTNFVLLVSHADRWIKDWNYAMGDSQFF